MLKRMEPTYKIHVHNAKPPHSQPTKNHPQQQHKHEIRNEREMKMIIVIIIMMGQVFGRYFFSLCFRMFIDFFPQHFCFCCSRFKVKQFFVFNQFNSISVSTFILVPLGSPYIHNNHCGVFVCVRPFHARYSMSFGWILVWSRDRERPSSFYFMCIKKHT